MRVSLRPLPTLRFARLRRTLRRAATAAARSGGPEVRARVPRAGDGALSMPVAPSPETMFGPRGHRWRAREDRCSSPTPAIIGCWSARRPPTEDHTPADFSSASLISSMRGATPRANPARRPRTCQRASPRRRGPRRGRRLEPPRPDLAWAADASNRPAESCSAKRISPGCCANRGGEAVRGHRSTGAIGVAIVDRSLIVCDTGNRRALIWTRNPAANGTPADWCSARREWIAATIMAGSASSRAACAGRMRRRSRRGALVAECGRQSG